MANKSKSTYTFQDNLFFYLILLLIVIAETWSNFAVPNPEIISQIQSQGYSDVVITSRNNFEAFVGCGLSGNVQVDFSGSMGEKNINLKACRGGVIPPSQGLTIKS